MLGTAVALWTAYGVGELYRPLVWLIALVLCPLVLAKNQEEVGKWTKYGVICNCVMFLVTVFDCSLTCVLLFCQVGVYDFDGNCHEVGTAVGTAGGCRGRYRFC